MSVNRIATRYAKSLLDLAVESNVLEAVKGDVEAFTKMVENRDLLLLLKSPIINATKKQRRFDALLAASSTNTNAFFSTSY